MKTGAVFPVCYLPPISFFSAYLAAGDGMLLEKQEHFPKQTYRNRASIYAPNGPLDLIIPVMKGSKVHTPVKDVRISYDAGWQRLHWLSLQTSYRSSAYFEYYEDEFAPFYEKREPFLFDFNEQLLLLVLRLLKIEPVHQYTEHYQKNYEKVADYRDRIHPKKKAEPGLFKPYYQVFGDRHGFISDLSVVDLLFSQGPQAGSYLL